MKLTDLDVTLNTGAVEWVLSTEIYGQTYALALEDPRVTDPDAIRRVTKFFRKKFALELKRFDLIDDDRDEIGLWASDF